MEFERELDLAALNLLPAEQGLQPARTRLQRRAARPHAHRVAAR